jgi:lysyl-tRNA synthetase class 2
MREWQPSATLNVLQQRARLNNQIREFFSMRSILEVDVPVIGQSTVTDHNIESMSVDVLGQKGFLQTSPEYFMKRLLASGSGDIFSLGKAFRQGEIGGKHNPEFALLEWYRCGWNEHQLMDEVIALLGSIINTTRDSPIPVLKVSYSDCVFCYLGFDPHNIDLDSLRIIAADLGSKSWLKESRENCLDLIFSMAIEAKLPDGLVLIYDYPECQAALSKIDSNVKGQIVSRRFEVFYNSTEIGNGYFELIDACEQVKRFDADVVYRFERQSETVTIDRKLIAALEKGLPECSGVAIGLDRLLMELLELKSIDQVLSFSWPTA